MERPGGVEYILVEASGVADPSSIALNLTLPKYQDSMRLDSVITVVDAEQLFANADQGRLLQLKLRQDCRSRRREAAPHRRRRSGMRGAPPWRASPWRGGETRSPSRATPPSASRGRSSGRSGSPSAASRPPSCITCGGGMRSSRPHRRTRFPTGRTWRVLAPDRDGAGGQGDSGGAGGEAVGVADEASAGAGRVGMARVGRVGATARTSG